jgi:hypothetical protein
MRLRPAQQKRKFFLSTNQFANDHDGSKDRAEPRVSGGTAGHAAENDSTGVIIPLSSFCCDFSLLSVYFFWLRGTGLRTRKNFGLKTALIDMASPKSIGSSDE